ncbi:MAG: hypothetical protein RJA10_4341 [Pseudomonadota bacterium]|jgi:hypothetical protein
MSAPAGRPRAPRLRRLWAWSPLLALLAGCGDDLAYTRKAGRWHHDDMPVVAADAASFQPLDARFARDAVQGYYRGQAIAGSHGPTFQVLSEHEARDRLAVYRGDTYRKAQEYWSIRHVRVDVIAGADPARYQVLGHGYARDGRQVWYEGQPFPVRDPASFTPIDSRFARDALRGYFDRTEVPGSHGPSFEVLTDDGGSHARDHRQVYSLHIELNAPLKPPHAVVRTLAGADPATVRVLGRGYAVDGSRVWWRGQAVAGADAGSFQVLDRPGDQADARDAKSGFLDGRRVHFVAAASGAGTGQRPL